MQSAAPSPIHSIAEYTAARALFGEYAKSLDVDLCFQNFAAELDDLRTMYGPPFGCIILARHAGQYAGCIGVRRFSDDCCEMKRLYVRDTARGVGIGRALAVTAIHEARSMGYRRMLLDSLDHMAAALRLYAGLGFREVAPYYHNPNAGVVFMELQLAKSEDGAAVTP